LHNEQHQGLDCTPEWQLSQVGQSGKVEDILERRQSSFQAIWQ
jgi:hypothetical protein